MRRLHVWLVNPFDPFPGDLQRTGRYAFFAQVLSDAGHSVTWWNSTFSHVTKNYRSACTANVFLPVNVRTKMLWAPPYRKNISGARIINHSYWARAFYKAALMYDDKPDIIISSSPPLMASRSAISLGAKLDSKILLDVQDLWPEAFEILFPSRWRGVGRKLLSPIRWIADSNYSKADGLIAVSETLLKRALSVTTNKTPGVVIPLGVDLTIYDNISMQYDSSERQQKHNEFWVVYVGTVGKTYDISTILDAAKKLMDQEGIRFFIAGTGPGLKIAQSRAIQLGVSNLEFTGFLSLEKLISLLRASNVGLIAIAPGAVSAFPYKLFDYLAVRLPVISSVKGELQELIAREGIGVSYEAGDPQSLVEAILTIREDTKRAHQMGEKGRKLAEQRFDRKVAYVKLLDLIDQVANKHG